MSFPKDYDERGQYNLGVKYTIKDMDKYTLDFMDFFESHRKKSVFRPDIILDEFRNEWLRKKT